MTPYAKKTWLRVISIAYASSLAVLVFYSGATIYSGINKLSNAHVLISEEITNGGMIHASVYESLVFDTYVLALLFAVLAVISSVNLIAFIKIKETVSKQHGSFFGPNGVFVKFSFYLILFTILMSFFVWGGVHNETENYRVDGGIDFDQLKSWFVGDSEVRFSDENVVISGQGLYRQAVLTLSVVYMFSTLWAGYFVGLSARVFQLVLSGGNHGTPQQVE